MYECQNMYGQLWKADKIEIWTYLAGHCCLFSKNKGAYRLVIIWDYSYDLKASFSVRWVLEFLKVENLSINTVNASEPCSPQTYSYDKRKGNSGGIRHSKNFVFIFCENMWWVANSIPKLCFWMVRIPPVKVHTFLHALEANSLCQITKQATK